MAEPIMEFKTQEELDASLAEWQTRLFLNDWTIRAVLCDYEPMQSKEAVAENEICVVRKSCTIRIVQSIYLPKGRPEKDCAEASLVHELCHCLFNHLDIDYSVYEKQFFDVHEHMRLEQMAKSLIMAKYNLTFDWFKNF